MKKVFGEISRCGRNYIELNLIVNSIKQLYNDAISLLTAAWERYITQIKIQLPSFPSKMSTSNEDITSVEFKSKDSRSIRVIEPFDSELLSTKTGKLISGIS